MALPRAVGPYTNPAPSLIVRPDISYFRAGAMADHSIPHFHNEPGVAAIRVGVKEFMCVGALPPFDHPHIFIDIGGDTDAICGYCSTRFIYDAKLGAHSDPAECELAA